MRLETTGSNGNDITRPKGHHTWTKHGKLSGPPLQSHCRLTTSFSYECKRRKVKCDGREPCGKCVRYSTTCNYAPPQRAVSHNPQSASAMLASARYLAKNYPGQAHL